MVAFRGQVKIPGRRVTVRVIPPITRVLLMILVNVDRRRRSRDNSGNKLTVLLLIPRFIVPFNVQNWAFVLP